MEKTKLTAVTIVARGKRVQAFLQLPIDKNGTPHIPMQRINALLLEAGIWLGRGGTISIG